MVHFNKDEDISEVALTLRFRTYVRLTVLILVTITLWAFVHKAAHALLLVFTAFFLALALNAPVYWVSKRLPGKRRGNRLLGTVLAYLIVIILLGAFIASIVPPLVRQTSHLINVAPQLVRDLHSENNPVGHFINHYHLQSQVNAVSQQLSARLQHIGGTAFTEATKIGSSFFSLLTILVLTFMMLVEGPKWVTFMRDIIPDKHHSMTDRLAQDMYRVIKGFVNGQVILAALAALLITPVALLLHVNYAAAIFVVIFICGLIPLIGHTIGAVIVTVIALFHSTSAALILLAYYIAYMQIEAYIVQPRIQANTTNMSPLLVFMSVVVGVSFGGLFGGLVAIPVAGCLRIALLEYLRSSGIIDTPRFEQVTGEAK